MGRRAVARSVRAVVLPALLAGALGVPAGPSTLAGQEASEERPARLVGQVVSAVTGEPLPGAVVAVRGTGTGAVADSSGRFRIPRTRAGQDTVEVRYLGYEDNHVPLYLEPGRTTRVVLLLSPNVVRVADLRVEVERDRTHPFFERFERRRKRGIGHFITYEDIQDRNPRYTTDMLRTVPGLRIGPVRGGSAEVQLGRNALPCSPPVFVDGVYYAGMEVDDVIAPDLGAIEVYTGAAQIPAEFATQAPSGCGAILIWTRRGRMPGDDEPGGR